MNLERAELLRSKLSSSLASAGYLSYPKMVKSEVSHTYQVKIVLHPEEASKLVPKLKDLETLPWNPKDMGKAKEYVKKTPRTPSQSTDQYGFYPSKTRRRQDGPSRSPDVNPAYPGLRRIPDLQDLVRRVAMRNDLKDRIASVTSTLKSLQKLEVFAAKSFRRESENLICDLLAQLAEDGHTGRHKIVKLTKNLKNALKDDGYSFQEN